MKTTRIILLVLLVTGLNLHAQSFEYGVKGGLNYGSTDDLEGSLAGIDIDETADNKVGFHLGLYSKFEVIGIFIQPELVYTRLNSEYELGDYSINKLDLPILAGIELIGPLNIKLGPSFQYIFSNDDLDSIEIGEVENDITVGYQAGLGLTLGRLGVDVRYEGNFFENESVAVDAAENTSFTLDNRPSQWILSLSYSLGGND
ncbi:outer membrane beta-barrel protein [Gangjinia marincola]